MYEAAFKLQMIDDQTAAFHMKDLHARARLVDEDERVAVLHVEAHLVGDDTAQRVEALAHVRRMRIIVSIRFFICEPRSYSGGVMRKRRGSQNAYVYHKLLINAAGSTGA